MNHLARIGLLLVGTAMLSPALPASAADYDPPIVVDQADEYVPVEVGSGWYLRGDVAYNFQRSYKDSAVSLDDTLFDNNLVGLGQIGPLDFMSYKEREVPVSGSIGMGYHFNDWIRGEVNIGLLADDKYSGTAHLESGYFVPGGFSSVNWANAPVIPDYGCLGTRTITTETTTTTLDADGNPVTSAPVINSSVDPDFRRDCMVSASANNRAWNGLANAYIDLGTIAGLTPYIGAGIGMLYTRTSLSASATCDDEAITTVSSSGNTTTRTTRSFDCATPSGQATEFGSYRESEYNLLYSLAAGFSYRINNSTSVDIGYQYLDAPNIKYYAVSGDGIRQRKGLDIHQVKVGLRYDLW